MKFIKIGYEINILNIDIRSAPVELSATAATTERTNKPKTSLYSIVLDFLTLPLSSKKIAKT